MSSEPIEVTVVLPCLNEAETLAVCVQKARHVPGRTRRAR